MKKESIAALVLMLNVWPITSESISDVIGQPWEKIKEENGVVVYSREIDGSDIIKVKTQVVIDANMEKIRSILDDVSNRGKWVPFLEESRVLKKYSATEKLEYSLFAAPWPASDRDFVYHQRLLYKDDKKIVFVMNVEEHELMPVQDGIVRADMIESQYTLISLTNNKTKVELIFYADPKGWLPDWLINKIQQVLPYRMLLNLKGLAESMTWKK